MEKEGNDSGWEKVPAIKLIVGKCQSLGPGGVFRWKQTEVRGPYWRIYWNDAPGAFVSCGGNEVELTPGKIIALSPDAVYSTRAERLVNHFYVHCFVSQPFSEIKGRIFVMTAPELARQASILAGKVNERADEPRTQMELLVYLNSVFLAIPAESVPDCPAYSPKVAKSMEILEKTQKISNDELAKSVNMSRNGFLFLFKKETRTSPQAYSRQLRLNEACIMLQHSDKSIDEIALETGFCDRYYFSRAFHQVIGCAPGQFRFRRYPTG
ncbi:MAG: AraC family transcriptional regulator [Victivallales bacterium]